MKRVGFDQDEGVVEVVMKLGSYPQ